MFESHNMFNSNRIYIYIYIFYFIRTFMIVESKNVPLSINPMYCDLKTHLCTYVTDYISILSESVSHHFQHFQHCLHLSHSSFLVGDLFFINSLTTSLFQTHSSYIQIIYLAIFFFFAYLDHFRFIGTALNTYSFASPTHSSHSPWVK